jgi:hypothetical protein
MTCPDCDRLRATYQRLERNYAAAHQALDLASAAPADEYAKLRVALNETRLDAESARLELEQHRIWHVQTD